MMFWQLLLFFSGLMFIQDAQSSKFPEEHDDIVQNCKVYHLSLDMDMEGMQEKIPQLQRIAKNLGGGEVVVNHWALKFEFENRSIVYESRPSDQKLHPVWMPMEEFKKSHETTLLGMIQISPKELYEKAKENPMNFGEYHFINFNCQDWIIKLIELVAPEFTDHVEKLKESTVAYRAQKLIEELQAKHAAKEDREEL